MSKALAVAIAIVVSTVLAARACAAFVEAAWAAVGGRL